MKKLFLTISLLQFLCAFAVGDQSEDIAVGDYILTTIELGPNGELMPHWFETHSAKITKSKDEYTITIRYGRAGIIALPLHVSGKRVSFFITPDSGTVDDRDILAKAFFGERGQNSISGWSSSGENRAGFKLERYQPIEPQGDG